MRLSEKRSRELYDAIYTPIMNLRVDLRMHPEQDVDPRLFRVTQDIWEGIRKTLNAAQESEHG